MSDYKHIKAVRLPVPKEFVLEESNPYNAAHLLTERLGDLYDTGNYSFFIEATDTGNYYIDWVYHSSYGEEEGTWYEVRYLTDKEYETIKPMFDKLGVEYEPHDLRLVNYCYYNCSEPDDCYEVVEKDESDLFFKKEN